MDAGRVTIWYLTVGLAASGAGCETVTSAKVGENTTLVNTFPSTIRSQSPPEIVPVAAVTQIPARAEPQVRVVAMIGADAVVTDDEVGQMVRQRQGEYVRLVGTERSAKEKE